MSEGLETIDRTIRVFGGITMLYASLGGVGTRIFMLQAFGLYGIITGLLGECFIYEIITEILLY